MDNKISKPKTEQKTNKDTFELNSKQNNNFSTIKNEDKTDIDIKKEKKINLEKKISNIKNDIINIQLRGQAEIENIRKKSNLNIQIIKNSQLEEFAKKIIPVIDALDEILTISFKNKITTTLMIQGIDLTLKSMLNIILKFGIQREGQKNTVFQPHLHQCISSKKSEKIQSNYIISVIKYGYTLNNIVLRKAVVETSL